jgi:hypothetical protein
LRLSALAPFRAWPLVLANPYPALT